MPEQAGQPTRTARVFFSGIVAYYWLLLFFEQPEENITRFSLFYFALVIPVLVFIVANYSSLRFSSFKPLSLTLAFYLGLVGLVSIVRSDFPTLYNAALFVLPIIIIVNSGMSLLPGFLNRLFLLSVIGSMITFYVGNNLYGFLPGQALSSEEQGLIYRVSLFPVLPESAFFSIMIFVINLLYNSSRYRYAYCAVALYFLLFSANRTSIVALLFIISFLFLSRRVAFQPRLLYRVLMLSMLLCLVLLANIDMLLPQLAVNLSSPVLNNYLFRFEDGVTGGQIGTTIYRGWLWAQHLSIYLQHPVLGAGTFKLDDAMIDGPPISQVEATGSESFLTGWVARVGLMVIPLIVFFWQLCSRAMSNSNKYLYSICILLLVFSLFYGSFLVPYNCMFLVLFGTINLDNHVQARFAPARLMEGHSG
jgi:O-Antigen ligase